MPKYLISKTVTTFYTVEIEADSEELAIAKAESDDTEWKTGGIESFIQGEGRL